MNDLLDAPDEAALHAWLDGELPAPRHAQVEAWLREHPEDAARVRLWAADGEGVRAQFDRIADEPVPPTLAALVQRRAPAGHASQAGFGGFGTFDSGWQRWAAAVAIFALGGAVGASLMWRSHAGSTDHALAEPAWVQRAAVAHAVYVPEVRHAVEVKAQEEHLSRWLTRRLDVPVKLFDLRAQGFELVGGRLLPDASGPSAQLMYQAIVKPGANAPTGAAPASGAEPAKPVRVTVYLRKPDAGTEAAFRYEQQGALGMFYWVEGESAHGKPTGYALVGALPRAQLLALAEAIYKQGETAR